MTLTWINPANPDQVVVWDGKQFNFDGQQARILRYPVSVEGWNSGLAGLMHSENDKGRPIGNASRRHVLNQINTYVPEAHGAEVLEIGCSTGLMLEALQEEYPGMFLAASDVDYDSLLSNAEKFPSVPLFQMDIAEASVPEGRFDCIISLNVLEHIKDDKKAIENIKRLLKDGGLLILELPAGAALYDVYDKELKHYRRYDMNQLVSLLKSTGLEVLEKSHLGFLPYPLFWLRKKLNRKHLESDESTRARITSQYMRQSKRSRILSAMFRIEEYLRKVTYLPFGIRCLVTCRKRA